MVMESPNGETLAVGKPCSAANSDIVPKASLDNIVGNLWQQRQESSGSSAGNQSPRNGEEMSDGEHEEPIRGNHSPERSTSPQESPDIDKDLQRGEIKVKDRRDLLKEGDPPDPMQDPRDILRDPRALLAAGLPPISALEAFGRQTRDFLSSQHLLANFRNSSNSLGLSPNLPPSSQLPSGPPSQPATPNSQRSSPVQQSSGGGSNSGGQSNWSFEEQFKQLYEIDDNPKRREFLDELFTLMQKRGTPINRLPIMAKQVLDLYELYNLVTARGGLVEVINKKMWQEVIKGLGLPSSITSAAFTLRTQYTKYLYPLECYKRNLSNPNDLQQAIEGNKREHRRSSYGSFPELLPHHAALQASGFPSQISPMPLVTGAPGNGEIRHHLNGSHPLPPTSRSPPLPGTDPISALEMTRLALWKMYNAGGEHKIPTNLPNLPGMPTAAEFLQAQDKALNLHMVQKQAEKLVKKADANDNETSEDKDDVVITRNSGSPAPERREIDPTSSPRRVRPREEVEDTINGDEEILDGEEDIDESHSLSPPPAKRSHPDDIHENGSSPKKAKRMDLPGANIKISSRNDGRNGDTSLVVSLEINGVNYQGVLFAQAQKFA